MRRAAHVVHAHDGVELRMRRPSGALKRNWIEPAEERRCDRDSGRPQRQLRATYAGAERGSTTTLSTYATLVRANLLAQAPERRIALVRGEAEADARLAGESGEIGGHVPPGLRRPGEDVLTAERRRRIELDDRSVPAVHAERDPLAAVHRDLDAAAVHRLGAAIGLGVDVGVEGELAPGRELERGRFERRVLHRRVALVLVRAGVWRERRAEFGAIAALRARGISPRLPLVARASRKRLGRPEGPWFRAGLEVFRQPELSAHDDIEAEGAVSVPSLQFTLKWIE
jgi:hypothetical protein